MGPPTSAGKEIGVRHRKSKTKQNRCLTPISRQAGFTYVAVLIMVAAMGAAMGAAAQVASTAAKREKEAELLFVGEQYRHAIESYYEQSPGGAKRFPQALEDLLEDRRVPTVRRHLRKLYPDPITGKPFATMQAPGGGIMGVHSPSEAAPLKTGNFARRDEALEKATTYAQWQFFYQPQALDIPPGDKPEGLPESPAGNTAKQ